MAYAKTVLRTWIATFELDEVLAEDVKEAEVRTAIAQRLVSRGQASEAVEKSSLGQQVNLLQTLIAEQDTENTEGQNDPVQNSLDKANNTQPPTPVTELTEESTPAEEKGVTAQAFSELNLTKVEEQVTSKDKKQSTDVVEDPSLIDSATMLLRNKKPGERKPHYNPEKEDLVIVLRTVNSIRVGPHSIFLQKGNKPIGIPKEIVDHLVRKTVVSRYD